MKFVPSNFQTHFACETCRRIHPWLPISTLICTASTELHYEFELNFNSAPNLSTLTLFKISAKFDQNLSYFDQTNTPNDRVQGYDTEICADWLQVDLRSSSMRRTDQPCGCFPRTLWTLHLIHSSIGCCSHTRTQSRFSIAFFQRKSGSNFTR